jgi:FdrA protein
MKFESLVIPDRYYDSVFLMRAAKRMSDMEGVAQAAAVMGTPRNIQILADAGFQDVETLGAVANDLVISLQVNKPEDAKSVFDTIEELLKPIASENSATVYRSLDQAFDAQPTSNIAVISVPGEYAAREARTALDRGLNVFMFSDNVPIDDELGLKTAAQAKGLLVMGPDCGTSIIDGKGIGFANVVRRGPIGVVGASGTGIQEVTTLAHNMGSGISHALGIGSRDLSDKIGGISALQAIDALEDDPATSVIVIISKPPDEATLTKVRERIGRCSKPVVTCFLGASLSPDQDRDDVVETSNLDAAVHAALGFAGGGLSIESDDPDDETATVEAERNLYADSQRYVRGVFAGGTFCLQSQQVFSESGVPVYSNSPSRKELSLADVNRGIQHSMVDMGADEFTVGRPHPMIDSTSRAERILSEAQDPDVAVLLLDFILGYGSSDDPVGELIPAISEAQNTVKGRGGHLTIVASICGTADDPQGLDSQKNMLSDAGVLVCSTNYRASRLALKLAESIAV